MSAIFCFSSSILAHHEKRIRAGRQYTIRDLWAHTDNGTAIRNITATAVPPHGVVALLLSDAGDEPDIPGLPPCTVTEWCMDQNGTRIDQLLG